MKFKVKVNRIGYSQRDIEVNASNMKEAKEMALDEAGNYEYSEHTSEYKVESTEKII